MNGSQITLYFIIGDNHEISFTTVKNLKWPINNIL